MITVTGARGGGGASTIAVNLAWHLGAMARRHTVLLDLDLPMGLAAFMLDLQPGPGLRLALEAPERIDALLAERLALPAGERLHVLAAHEKITAETIAAPGAAGALTEGLRRRYSFIVADVPFLNLLPLDRDLLDLANQRVLVMEPTLACVRDVIRLLVPPAGAAQPRRAVVVLNRAGSAGGMTRKQVEEAIGVGVDIAIPNLPRQLGASAILGELAVERYSGFRAAIAELARQAAPVRLLDGASLPLEADGGRVGLWQRLRRRRQ